MKISKHFSREEFDCKDGTEVPDNLMIDLQRLVSALEVIRYACGGQSITINSGYRTKSYNESIGGASKSKHLEAIAADIVVENMNPVKVAERIEKLIRNGHIPQGGLKAYATFTHYDIRGTKARW